MSDELAFAAACRRPFANGTEFDVWMSKWCNFCARDHEMHTETGPGCGLIAASMVDEWPEGWIPEPDDGQFSLPSRLVCTAFIPCEPCGGDPFAEPRAERVAEVTAYWRARRAS